MIVIDHSLVPCVSCHTILPADKGFYVSSRHGKLVRDKRCKECVKLAERERDNAARRAAGIPPKSAKPRVKTQREYRPVWPMTVAEYRCNEAFKQWRGPVEPLECRGVL